MKKIFLLTTIILFAVVAKADAATTAPKATPTSTANNAVKSDLNKQIDQLKDKIASRVSELNLVEKRGIIGTVTDVKASQITVNDTAGNVRFIDVDEITKFSSANAKGTFGLSDITKGTKISILGIYNKQSKRLLARFIDTVANPVLNSGEISAIDPKQFQITLATDDQKELKIDIDTSSKVSSYTNADGIAKYGFSKLAVGDRIAFAGFPDKTTPSLIAASRILDFLEAPKDPKIVVAAPTATPSASITTTPIPTAAGKKLAPIK